MNSYRLISIETVSLPCWPPAGRGRASCQQRAPQRVSLPAGCGPGRSAEMAGPSPRRGSGQARTFAHHRRAGAGSWLDCVHASSTPLALGPTRTLAMLTAPSTPKRGTKNGWIRAPAGSLAGDTPAPPGHMPLGTYRSLCPSRLSRSALLALGRVVCPGWPPHEDPLTFLSGPLWARYAAAETGWGQLWQGMRQGGALEPLWLHCTRHVCHQHCCHRWWQHRVLPACLLPSLVCVLRWEVEHLERYQGRGGPAPTPPPARVLVILLGPPPPRPFSLAARGPAPEVLDVKAAQETAPPLSAAPRWGPFSARSPPPPQAPFGEQA